jgi:hypothetical protein
MTIFRKYRISINTYISRAVKTRLVLIAAAVYSFNSSVDLIA